MSPQTRTTRRGRVRPVRYRAVQWPMVAWLSLVWWVLWGSYSLFSLLGGVVVSVAVCLVFPLPPLRMKVRVRPVALAVLVGRFLVDVVVASLQVARTTLFPPTPLHNALVAVQLRTESDIVLTAVAEMVSLVPGSVVVEAHRSSHTLFLHALDVRDQAGVERVRAQVWAQEARLVRAFGADTAPLDTGVGEAR
ncbi:multisubunit sodium/proton antiporter, MrpE subunit [Nocardioides scoriae]|uniref:Multisubunit sodium/proton antiporter, MrpE subunit n=1 Tax=Nocardioides scoriae TaxID=642780 RepID=A0A1H1LUF6_9ACTN|nr:Na+/H+ antiporter subunit E [Nocardioides scoriae]SDR77980.1 multisubunit sodium/proton antiporter, MrpE subunit [Nocardioides scoriae]